jgi:hypothetical protein
MIEDPFELDVNIARKISKDKLIFQLKKSLANLIENKNIWQ